MKKILIAILLLSACKKDNVSPTTSAPTNTVPSDIIGSYHGHSDCSPNGSYTENISVLNYSSTAVKITSLPQLTDDTLIVTVSGNTMTVTTQSFPNTGWSGGTKTVIGSGVYSSPQIQLNLSVTFTSGQPTIVYNCTTTINRQ